MTSSASRHSTDVTIDSMYRQIDGGAADDQHILRPSLVPPKLSRFHLFNLKFPSSNLFSSRQEFAYMQRPRNLVLMMALLALFSSSSFFFFLIVRAQVTIPARFDGFVYKNGPVGVDSIMIEAFFDPVCPDSRDAWPPLKQALQYYGDRLSLIVHPFALPYHDNAFVSSRALHIVNKLNTSATYALLELFFEHQEEFYNQPTFNMSRASVVSGIVNMATKAVGNSYYSAVASGFTDRNTDLMTRVSFKYGCSRGVFGTPFFFVNGFPLPDAGSAIDYSTWRSIIDPLINEKA